ncbi:MAG: TetR/AcrR family transcriptional regulator [Acidimicrobiia bacterium]
MCDQREGHPDGAVAVVRRAPFSDNPRVGARGQRTQQRILDAALRAFGEEGYHGCSIDRITRLARCSRVSFYQYFAGKEDVFRQLAGQVARQVSASTEALDPLTSDLQGWQAMRAWVARYAEIHARYEPVFHAYETDEVLAALALHTGEETIARIHARLATTTLPPRQLNSVIRLLLECLNHTLDVRGILTSVAPDAYPAERFEVATTDVLHRTLFGVRAAVNVHPPGGSPPPTLEFGPELLEMFRDGGAVDPDASCNLALAALLASGRDVFVDRGYHGTRVDDLVTAADVSHGAFYRYFRNKEQLARILTASAVRAVGTAVMEIPDVSALEGPTGKSVLRRWLRRYNAAHANEALMLRVWVDAALQDPAIRAESAPVLDWGRRRMSRYLRPRGIGDPDMEAVVMVALFGVFGARQRPPAEVEAAAHIIERGLLGR